MDFNARQQRYLTENPKLDFQDTKQRGLWDSLALYAAFCEKLDQMTSAPSNDPRFQIAPEDMEAVGL